MRCQRLRGRNPQWRFRVSGLGLHGATPRSLLLVLQSLFGKDSRVAMTQQCVLWGEYESLILKDWDFSARRDPSSRPFRGPCHASFSGPPKSRRREVSQLGHLLTAKMQHTTIRNRISLHACMHACMH